MTEHYDHDQAAAILRPVAQHLATHRPAPSFAEQLTADDYAQADARAATAEQDRDDALDDLRHTKADRDRLNGLLREAESDLTRLKTHLNSEQARLRGHIERTRGERDQALASRRRLLDDMNALTRAIGRQTNETDNLRQQLDATNTERARLAEELAETHAIADQAQHLAAQRAERINNLHRRFTAAAPIADHAHRTIRAIRAARAHTCGTFCAEGGCDFDLSGFVDQVDAILRTTPEMPKESIAIPVLFDRDPDCGCTPPCGHGAYCTAAGLGSSRRAHGCICPLPVGAAPQVEQDPDCSVHGQDARSAQDSYAQGYAEAVARLRDDVRYGNWWSSSPESLRPTQPIRGHLADYLETVGPDGPDVERPIHQVTGVRGELERLSAGLAERNIRPEPDVEIFTVDLALTALDRFLTVAAALVEWRNWSGKGNPAVQDGKLVDAVDELLASWPGMDLSVPAVSIAEAAAKSTVPTAAGAYHWGRAWAPSDIEAKCPCPKAPCGYVIRDQESPDCDQHNGNRTMRGGHSAERCAEDRP